MAALGVRKTAWQGLSTRNRQIVRYLGELLELGDPAEYEQPGGTRWFVFDDHRFKAKFVAYFGCVLANLTEIPVGYVLPLDGGELDRPQMRADIQTFCESPARTNPLVLPEDIVFTEDGNPWQEILDAQGTPDSVQMASAVPSTWTAVNDDEVVV